MNNEQLREVIENKKNGSSLVEWIIAFYPMMVNLFGEEKVDDVLENYEFELSERIGGSKTGSCDREKKYFLESGQREILIMLHVF